jgi:hypothetical protein
MRDQTGKFTNAINVHIKIHRIVTSTGICKHKKRFAKAQNHSQQAI